MKVKRALISVSDKTGLKDLVKELDKLKVEIISTGGTAKAIKALGINVVEVSSYTGFPEMLDGRVKTIHPKIHGGLLALRKNKDHMRQIKENDMQLIDMVVVNLYPFEETISRKGVTEEEAIENIDIGGPTMLRSAAKNFRSVAVVSSPSQYEKVTGELKKNGGELSESLLKDLAAEVFAKTSKYDGLIAKYLSGSGAERSGGELPDILNIKGTKVYDLRYGENPHQHAAFYKDASSTCKGVADARKLQGKQLSFNNIMDLDVAMAIVKDFSTPAVSIIKHNNPCGAATADTLEAAFKDALDCDRMSAFGSIMGFNMPITEGMAKLILGEADFVECIIAPDYEDGALEVFKSKQNLRILRLQFLDRAQKKEKDVKKVLGGILLQDVDIKDISRSELKTVTDREVPEELIDSLVFGWKVVKYVKSNSILLCQGTKTVGIGAGQMSRVDSVKIAIDKAGERARGAVLASDAFFPMADSIEEAHRAEIAAIIQPGGSIHDEEVIKSCNHFGIPMVFTGVRHFRH